jgi:enoyl-CoA hydratase
VRHESEARLKIASPDSFDEAACRAHVRECFESSDYREGRRAFMDKRRPAFQGR